MTEFLVSRMDYIYFCYGLSFMLMAVSCYAMGDKDRGRLGWGMLGLFGIAHGMNEWLDLIAYSFGDDSAFSQVRLGVLIISFLFLMEFGRAGTLKLAGRGPGRWLLLALAGAAALGASHGMAGINAAARYMLGFGGGVWASAFLFMAASREKGQGGIWLASAAVAIGLYAFATGLVVPQVQFFPASLVNNNTFLLYTGVPIQAVRCVLAVVCALSVTAYSRKRRTMASYADRFVPRPAYIIRPMLIVFALVAAGFFLADVVGNADIKEYVQNNVKWVRTIAGTLEPDLTEMLDEAGPVEASAGFRHIRNHLLEVRRDNPDCISAYIRTMKDGGLAHVADGEEEGSQSHHGYGYPLEGLGKGETELYVGSVTARYDSSDPGYPTVRVMAPMSRYPKGGMVAQLDMVFNASSARRAAINDRFYAITITGTLCMLTIVGFIAWVRTKESVAQLAELRVASLAMENEKKLRNITSALGEGVIVTDKACLTVFMNPEAERLLGYTEAELAGKDAHDAVHFQHMDGTPTERDKCPTMISIASGTRQATDDDAFTRKDGSIFPASLISAPIMVHGVVTGAVIAFRDISLEKNARESLARSESSYRALSENLPGIVYRLMLGAKNEMIFFNDMSRQMTGYAPDELEPGGFCSIETLMVEKDRGRVLNEVNLAIMEDRTFQVEYRIRHRDGGIRHFLERGRPVRGEDGTPICIDGVILDISELKQAEEELIKYKFMVEESGEEMYLVDREGRFRYANRTACEHLGYTCEELAGLGMEDVDPAFSGDKFRAHFEELKTRDLPVFETRHITRDGRTVTKEVKAVHLKIGGEEFIGAIARDISERKELERQRADFFSMVTHDIKSPLTVIQAYAEIMQTDMKGELTGEMTDIVASIRSSSRKLLGMVEDFLAVSRLESGTGTTKMSVMNTAEVAYEAFMGTQPLAEKKGIEFTADISGAPEPVMADRVLVSRAVGNLLQNAINYTQAGGKVRLAVYSVTMDGVEYAAISVSDTGPGIPPEEREKVFNKYYRSPGVAGTKGSGLGLAIVKAVADAHGGRVVLDTKLGEGSTFTLLVPRKPA